MGGQRACFRDHEGHFWKAGDYFSLTTVSDKKATLVKFRSGKRTQFNITNITK